MKIADVTQKNFQEKVLKASQPVLVDFWASWCTPCKMFAPVLEEVSREQPNLQIMKVNVEEENELAGQYHVQSIPTLLLFEQGVIRNSSVGVLSKEQILQMLD